jgi:hypothetical protein
MWLYLVQDFFRLFCHDGITNLSINVLLL